jgi:hypothetical protein
MLCTFASEKKSTGEVTPALSLANASIAGLIAVHGADQLLEVRRRRLEGGQLP